MSPLLAFALGCAFGPLFVAGAGLLLINLTDYLRHRSSRQQALHSQHLTRYFRNEPPTHE